MERKLVGDLEHEGEPDYELESQHSAQTNELIEGYEEANMSPRSLSGVDWDDQPPHSRGGSLFDN